jgi:hypothetical protein
MRMTLHAKVTRLKGRGVQGQGKNDVAPKTTKGWKFGKKCWKGPECKIGMKNPGTRQQLHLKIEGTSEGFNRKAFGLEFMKQATGMSSGLRKVMDQTVWRGQPPPKWKKNLLALLESLA